MESLCIINYVTSRTMASKPLQHLLSFNEGRLFQSFILGMVKNQDFCSSCLLYTSDAADEGLGVDLGGRRIIKKKT